MDRVQEMNVFCAVVEEHGFAAAARRVGLSAPAVTRSVAALEARIGARLIDRGAGNVRLTDAGRRFHEEARALLAALDLADESAAGPQAVPKGHVTLSAPVMFGETVLAPILLDWLEANPLVTLRAQLVDRTPNLHEEAIDLAVSMGIVAESGLVAVLVGHIHRVVCAAPAYLDARGTPDAIDALAHHRIVQSTADAPGGDWRFERAGARSSLRVDPALVVSTNLAAIEAAREGFGVTRVMSYQVAEDLALGRLVAVLTDADDAEVPVHLLHVEGRSVSPKVASLLDFLQRGLTVHPALARR